VQEALKEKYSPTGWTDAEGYPSQPAAADAKFSEKQVPP